MQKSPLPGLQNSHFTSDSSVAFSLSLFSLTSKALCGVLPLDNKITPSRITMNNPLVTLQVCYLRIMQIFLSSYSEQSSFVFLQHLQP